MKVEVKEKKDNPLLERKEVSAVVEFEGPTPKRSEIKDAVCSAVGARQDMSVLIEVKQRFGEHKVGVVLHAYNTKERMERVESRHMLKRDGLIGEKKEGEGNGGEAS